MFWASALWSIGQHAAHLFLAPGWHPPPPHPTGAPSSASLLVLRGSRSGASRFRSCQPSQGWLGWGTSPADPLSGRSISLGTGRLEPHPISQDPQPASAALPSAGPAASGSGLNGGDGWLQSSAGRHLSCISSPARVCQEARSPPSRPDQPRVRGEPRNPKQQKEKWANQKFGSLQTSSSWLPIA